MTVSEAFAAYDVDVLFSNGMSKKTRKNYVASLNSWCRACGPDIPINIVTHSMIITMEAVHGP